MTLSIALACPVRSEAVRFVAAQPMELLAMLTSFIPVFAGTEVFSIAVAIEVGKTLH